MSNEIDISYFDANQSRTRIYAFRAIDGKGNRCVSPRFSSVSFNAGEPTTYFEVFAPPRARRTPKSRVTRQTCNPQEGLIPV